MIDTFVNKVVQFGIDNNVSKTPSGHFIAHSYDLSISTDGLFILAIIYKEGEEVERKVIENPGMAKVLCDRLQALHGNKVAENVKTISNWIDIKKEK